MSSDEVTRILDRAAAGDRLAAESLLPLVYDQDRAEADALEKRLLNPDSFEEQGYEPDHDPYLDEDEDS